MIYLQQNFFIMSMTKPLIAELTMEAANTKKMLERVPFAHPDWRPHGKSAPMGRLATHVAERPGWITMTLNTNELDLSKLDRTPTVVNNSEELIAIHEKNIQ